HFNRDEVVCWGVHVPTNGGARSACETGGKPPISALTMNPVLARTKALELLDLGPNPARDKAVFGWNISPSQGPHH
ncbi:hypothetical protein, partial [Salmonella enterica]|uniref:hypothetical protein n=1 Tax=Salmonella enterica TaxID=28901 RepID=UPI003FD8935C